MSSQPTLVLTSKSELCSGKEARKYWCELVPGLFEGEKYLPVVKQCMGFYSYLKKIVSRTPSEVSGLSGS